MTLTSWKGSYFFQFLVERLMTGSYEGHGWVMTLLNVPSFEGLYLNNGEAIFHRRKTFIVLSTALYPLLSSKSVELETELVKNHEVPFFRPFLVFLWIFLNLN